MCERYETSKLQLAIVDKIEHNRLKTDINTLYLDENGNYLNLNEMEYIDEYREDFKYYPSTFIPFIFVLMNTRIYDKTLLREDILKIEQSYSSKYLSFLRKNRIRLTLTK